MGGIKTLLEEIGDCTEYSQTIRKTELARKITWYVSIMPTNPPSVLFRCREKPWERG